MFSVNLCRSNDHSWYVQANSSFNSENIYGTYLIGCVFNLYRCLNPFLDFKKEIILVNFQCTQKTIQNIIVGGCDSKEHFIPFQMIEHCQRMSRNLYCMHCFISNSASAHCLISTCLGSDSKIFRGCHCKHIALFIARWFDIIYSTVFKPNRISSTGMWTKCNINI